MPTDFGFRFSTYLALGLACATLGYSEFQYLPSVSVIAAGVLVLLVVAFRRDGRNEMSLATANRVGMVIGIAVIAYLAFQYFRPETTLLDRLPFPAGMLPYLGPVFLVLIPAKLFRPKHVGDWWAMHGVGLAVVCLACVMEDDTPLAVLVSSYLVVCVWSLMLFYFRRGGGAVPPVPRANAAATPEAPTRVVSAADAPPRSRFGGIRARRPVSYLAAAAAAGFLLFILTPRTDTPQWSLASYREVGLSTDEQAPDLTKEGDLKDNKDRAFEVTARNRDGSPKTDLDPAQRWRGPTFVNYSGGKWQPQKSIRGTVVAITASVRPPAGMEAARPMFQQARDAAGEAGFELLFDLNGKRKDVVCADPIWWGPGIASPLSSKRGTTDLMWFQLGDGTFVPPGGQLRTKQYSQVYRPLTEPDLGPAFQLQRGTIQTEPRDEPGGFGLRPRPPDKPPNRRTETEDEQYLAVLSHLRNNPLPRVRTWTLDLLAKLTRDGSLPGDVFARYSETERSFPVADFEAVARAVCKHFASSGEFVYGTENARSDKKLDPVEDFLFNTKTGSCEWYATALTMCLRSVGIPAQCVLGFKGCEHEEDGRYTIRQDHAHAWVEVLIPRPIPPGMPLAAEFDPFRNPLPPPTKAWHWLSLDPTPGTEAAADAATGISGLWESIRVRWLTFFNDFVVRYDPERRQRAAAAFEKWASANWRTAGGGLAAVVGLVAAAVLWRRHRRSAPAAVPTADPVPAWYRQLLSLAANAGHTPAASETPGEFAVRLATAVPDTREPVVALTDALYRVRYGGEPPPPADSFAPALAALRTVLLPARPDDSGI